MRAAGKAPSRWGVGGPESARGGNVADMTLAEWEAELRELRSNLGPTTTMRLSWRWRGDYAGSSALELVTGRNMDDSLVFALYGESAQPGDLPTVEVEVEPDPSINLVE